MRPWRSHPIMFAALLGAITGFANAIILTLVLGQFPVMTNHVLLLLWPTSILAFGFLDGGSRAFVTFLLDAEFGGNALTYALAFAAPVSVTVAVRRSFGTPEQPTSITQPD